MYLDKKYSSRHKILILCHSLARNGANNHVLQLINNLNDIFDFSVLALSDGPMKKSFKKICKIVEIWNGRSFDFNYFSLVIGNTLMTSRLLLKAGHFLPSVLVIHESWNPSDLKKHILDFEFSEKITDLDVTNAIQSASAIVLPAQFQLSLYHDIFSQQQKICNIPCTVAIDEINDFTKSHTKELARRELGIKVHEKTFLQVGTVTMRKNQLGTVDMFHGFCKRNPEISPKLILLGARRSRHNETAYLELVQNRLSHLDIKDKVEIVSCQDNPYIYMRAADCMIHPSLNEVLPLSIIEAGIFGLGVIAARRDGIPELVENASSGLLIDPENLEEGINAMETMVKNATLNERFGSLLKKKVLKNHSQKTFRERWKNLLQERLSNAECA